MSDKLSTDGDPLLSSGNDSASLDDINYLLYLETFKRFREEEQNLRRQVEEKARQYEEVKAEYRFFYELYVQLYQAAVTRGVLQEDHNLSGHLKQANCDISSITEKVRNDKVVAHFDTEVLNQVKEILCSTKTHDRVQKIQSEMVNQKEAVKVIQGLNEAIQTKLEAATTQGLDYFVELAQAKQLEDLHIQDRSYTETI